MSRGVEQSAIEIGLEPFRVAGGGVTVSLSGCSEDPEPYPSRRADAESRGCGSSETLDCTSAKASSSRLILSTIHLTLCFFSVPSEMVEFDMLKDNQNSCMLHMQRGIP